MKAENPERGYLQRDSAEHEGYAGAQSTDCQEIAEADGANLLEQVLERNNLNRAYKRVRANKGAPGIDGMTVEEALPWLKENKDRLLQSIRDGKYKPQPVRRVEIPKPNGGVRALGIPTVVDRIIQQAIAQILTAIFDPLFSEDSFGYRPGRSAHMTIRKVEAYAKAGYTQAVLIDLSKYFDTLNHDLLMNMIREEVKDKRVIDLIKKYLKSGVMVDGLLVGTEEGSPQGGPLSPLLANIYLNKYDWEMQSRGVKVVRYADDIVVLAKSKRAAERLLESSKRYLEQKLKLRVNLEKSRVCSVYSYRNFKFLGFALGKGKNGTYIRAHAESMKKAKDKLRILTSRSQGRSVRYVMAQLKIFVRGWLAYFGIAKIKRYLKSWDEWLRRRLRMYIWKQWKKPRTRIKNLMKLGMPDWQAYRNGNTSKGYWRIAGSGILTHTITNKRLVQAGYYSLLDRYESVHLCS